MKRILIALLLGIMCISSYGGGGIVVTQGDCCGGGTENNQVQRNVRAINLLTTIDDTTVIDGGIADRNTIKQLDTFVYKITQSSQGDRRMGIRDTVFGVSYDGFYYGGKKNLLNGILDLDTVIYLTAAGEDNDHTIIIDTNYINLIGSNPTGISHLNILGDNYYMAVDNYSTGEAMRNTMFANDYSINNDNFSIIGNYYPYTSYRQNNQHQQLVYDDNTEALIPGERVSIDLGFLSGESQIYLTSMGGEYNLNTAGLHRFISVLPTTASFNGDIEATAFNIISDKNLKENIKEAKSVGLLDIPIYTYNYNGVIDKDTIYYYDTIGYKSINKDIEHTDAFGNKSKKTIAYKEPITNKAIQDIIATKISQPTQYGLMAQDIAKIAPEAVTDNGDYQSVDYAQIVALLIIEVKELKNEIEILKQK